MYKLSFSVPLVASIFVVAAAQAETKTYTGMGNMERNELTMKLGGGQTVFNVWSEGLVTISTTPPDMMRAKCMGLGLIAAKGKSEIDVYCTFRTGTKHAIDFKAKAGHKSGTAEVIGGSGKWKDASGTVVFERQPALENRSRFFYKMTITTP